MNNLSIFAGRKLSVDKQIFICYTINRKRKGVAENEKITRPF